MSNLNQLLLYTESVHEKQRKRKFKDWILLCTILFVSMITFYSCSDSGGTSPDLDSEPDPEEPVMEDPPPAPKLSDIVDSIRAEYNFPAMGAAIVTLEKGFTIGVSGERRLGSGVAVQNGDHWSWGSNTKAITAFITARAVDDGLLLWDQTLEELFPEFTDEMRDEYRSVTLLDLLGHRSGFVNMNVPGIDGQSLGNGVTASSQRMEMIEWALQQPPNNPKGEYYYSNLGYSTVGAILERAFNETYEDWAVEHLSDFLDLETFGYGPQDADGNNEQPVSHRLTDGDWAVWENHESTPFRRPSGGAHGSLEDWGLIIFEMMRAENGSSNFISTEAASVINTPLSEIPGGSQYSAGWIQVGLRNWAGGEAWTHAGSNGANYSLAWVGPNAGVAFLVVVNAQDAEGITSEAANSMISELLSYWQEWIQ
jgi:CubicO group peptidase (beta-lactamase class C family)